MSLYFTRDQPPSSTILRHVKREIESGFFFFFNVLSFIARSAFYGGVTSVADNHDEKFIRIFDFHRRRDRFLLKVFTRKMRERGFFGGGEVRSSVG